MHTQNKATPATDSAHTLLSDSQLLCTAVSHMLLQKSSIYEEKVEVLLNIIPVGCEACYTPM